MNVKTNKLCEAQSSVHGEFSTIFLIFILNIDFTSWLKYSSHSLSLLHNNWHFLGQVFELRCISVVKWL